MLTFHQMSSSAKQLFFVTEYRKTGSLAEHAKTSLIERVRCVKISFT